MSYLLQSWDLGLKEQPRQCEKKTLIWFDIEVKLVEYTALRVPVTVSFRLRSTLSAGFSSEQNQNIKRVVLLLLTATTVDGFIQLFHFMTQLVSGVNWKLTPLQRDLICINLYVCIVWLYLVVLTDHRLFYYLDQTSISLIPPNLKEIRKVGSRFSDYYFIPVGRRVHGFGACDPDTCKDRFASGK